MNNDWETFHIAYQAATPEQQNLVDSTVIPECVRSVIASKNLSPTSYRELVKIFSLFFLGAIDEATIITYLKTIGLNNEEEVFNAVLLCQSVTKPQEEEIDTDDIDEEIEETENIINSIPHVRTMANDMKLNLHNPSDEVVHLSSQDSLLRK